MLMQGQAMAHVFISYSKKNRDYARRLADHLLDQGFDVWIDDRIDYGDEWWEVIERAISECAAFVLIMTPDSKSSKWVKREVGLADQQGKVIFPLLLSGENWGLFVITQYADVRDGQLPPPNFSAHLAEYAPRREQRGTPMVNRPPRSRPHAYWVVGALAVLVVIVAIIIATLLISDGGGKKTTPPAASTPEPTTAMPTSLDATSAARTATWEALIARQTVLASTQTAPAVSQTATETATQTPNRTEIWATLIARQTIIAATPTANAAR
jgi:hypothetical protein